MKALLLGLVAISLALGLSACQSEKTSGQSGTMEPEAVSFTTMTVEELHDALPTKDFVLVNVHIPYAGELPQTDLFIPFNEIEQNLDTLPANQEATIVLYCRSGGMSDSASKVLAELGYTDIVDVPGGMNAWKAAGYELLQQEQ